MDFPQLWFREIRPSLGEDKKLPKYGIIGKICITGFREIPATAHRMPALRLMPTLRMMPA